MIISSKNKYLTILLVLTVLLYGCSFGKNTDTNIDSRQTGNAGYEGNSYLVQADEDEQIVINSICCSADKYIGIASKFNSNLQNTVIYEFNSSGEFVKQLDVDIGSITSMVLNEDNLYCLSYQTIYKVNTETGEISEFDNPNHASWIASYDDGYVLCSTGIVQYFSQYGEPISEISNEDWRNYGYYTPFFEVNDKAYVMCLSDISASYNIYELDFDNVSSTFVKDASDYGFDITNYCGNYIFDDEGEKYIDPIQDMPMLLCSWADTDIIPAAEANAYGTYVPLDGNRFAIIYNNAVTGNCEFQFYRYDKTIDNSDKIILTVGGFGVSYDQTLSRVIYKFNTSQNEYRVVINQYDHTASNIEEEADIVARLIADFNSGEAPDMLYGNNFDFNSLGSMGLAMDLTPYINDGSLFEEDDVLPEIVNIMKHEDKCYSLFNGFYLDGYWGLESETDGLTNLTAEEFYSLSNTQRRVAPMLDSATIATWIIGKSFDTIIGQANSEHVLTLEQIENVVSLSIENGLDANQELSFPGTESLRSGDYLAVWTGSGNILGYYNLCKSAGEAINFMGFPSVYGSAHVASPNLVISVMQNTEYPEACIEFLSYLYDEEIQNYVFTLGYCPVNSDVFDETCSNTQEYLSDGDFVPSDIVVAYKNAIGFIDTYEMNNWGLYNIIEDEINSYDTQGKSIEEIAQSLQSRMDLYVQENY